MSLDILDIFVQLCNFCNSLGVFGCLWVYFKIEKAKVLFKISGLILSIYLVYNTLCLPNTLITVFTCFRGPSQSVACTSPPLYFIPISLVGKVILLNSS